MALAEREMGVPVLWQVLFQQTRKEVLHLVPFSAEPCVVPVGEDGVQDHQTLHESTQRGGFAIPVVGLPDRLVQGLVPHVKQAASVQRAREDRRGVAAADELGHEVPRVLAMGDAGERPVLSLDKDAGVDQDRHQEARLTPGEAERGESLDALGPDAVTPFAGEPEIHRKSFATRGSKGWPPPRPPPP